MEYQCGKKTAKIITKETGIKPIDKGEGGIYTFKYDKKFGESIGALRAEGKI